jgi:hypothetical protein
VSTIVLSAYESDDERRLSAFDLSKDIFHNGLRAGASRATNRTELALESSAGTDIYHDGMENLHQILRLANWRLVFVDQQPRLLHPAGIVSFTISSGINVGKTNMRTPRTRKKGPATRKSLAAPEFSPGLFEDVDAEVAAQLAATAQKAPFYFLLCERATVGGNGLILEFSQPAGMTDGGSVNKWTDRISVPFLDLEGDFSVFEEPDEGNEIVVPVEAR